MKEIALKTFAKINLSLKIINKLKNGYHNIDSIFTSIDLADLIKIKLYKEDELSKKEKAKYIDNVRIVSNNKGLPKGKTNIIYKVINLIKYKIKNKYYFTIYINKKIPISAGLGGGSSNAAGVYLGILRLLNTKLKNISNRELAYKIGADVPFFINGGTARVSGVGEKISKLKYKSNVYIVLVNPDYEISTKWVYKEYDKFRTKNKVILLDRKPLRNIFDNNALLNIGNDLEKIVLKKHAKLSIIKTKLLEMGAYYSQLSGSGPTIFGLFKNKNIAKKAVKYFITQGYWARLVTPYNQGILFKTKK